ncbi:MAG: hypothetical protein ACREJU_19300 [Nitrospiraceae bacterium]
MTFSSLTMPMQHALAKTDLETDNVYDLLIAYAKQHVQAEAREVGGANCGPWVRLYMDGHDGEDALCVAALSDSVSNRPLAPQSKRSYDQNILV